VGVTAFLMRITQQSSNTERARRSRRARCPFPVRGAARWRDRHNARIAQSEEPFLVAELAKPGAYPGRLRGL
jgi:hypothetical protein